MIVPKNKNVSVCSVVYLFLLVKIAFVLSLLLSHCTRINFKAKSFLHTCLVQVCLVTGTNFDICLEINLAVAFIVLLEKTFYPVISNSYLEPVFLQMSGEEKVTIR